MNKKSTNLHNRPWSGVVRVEQQGANLVCRSRSGAVHRHLPFDRWLRKDYEQLLRAAKVIYVEASLSIDGFLLFGEINYPQQPF